MEVFLRNRKIRASLHTFDVIADRLAHIRGRKTVIWLSTGFPMTIDSSVVRGANPGEIVYNHEFEQAVNKLNASDVAIYSVDGRGLTAGASRGYPGTLQELALRTGGTAFIARNDLDNGIKQAFEDMNSAYVLGFNVPEGAAPGSHKIRVRAKRPGITLRYRESYANE